jgi:hypothetical protein
VQKKAFDGRFDIGRGCKTGGACSEPFIIIGGNGTELLEAKDRKQLSLPS